MLFRSAATLPETPLRRAGLPPAIPAIGDSLQENWLRKGKVADRRRDYRLKLTVSGIIVALVVWAIAILF